MTITTTTVLPPLVTQYFIKQLFSTRPPTFLFGTDDLEMLIHCHHYIKTHLWKKLKNLPERRKKCELLEKELLELYDKIEKRQKETKVKSETKTQEPYYFIRLPTPRDQAIFRRLRYASRKALGA